MSRIDPYHRDLNYYENIDKVYWVPVNDITLPDGNIIKADTPTPCIYVEDKGTGTDPRYHILQFDMSMETDKWQYTAWRKVLGVSHGIRVDVFLIHRSQLYTLKGDPVDFDSLGRSDIWIGKEFLGRMGIKKK